jgi:hypothetical protein
MGGGISKLSFRVLDDIDSALMGRKELRFTMNEIMKSKIFLSIA